jgi:IS1 family transposase
VTVVDRATRCILGWEVLWDRSREAIQSIVDRAAKAQWYFSDAFDVYDQLWYHWGRYAVSEGKTDTYSVEADNAELRHYLARLGRASRCFHVARMPYRAPCVYLCTATTIANSRAASTPPIPST